MKVCKKCGAEKPLEEFHRDGGSPDGCRPRCKVCVKAYDDTLREERNRRAREKYAADPETKKRKTRLYHLLHPEWSRERLRAHHVKNRDERYARHQERGLDPAIAERRRESTRRSESRRRAIKAGQFSEILSESQFAARLAEFNGCCYICGIPLEADLHWDHYQPLAHGGTHTINNLFPACDLCNVRKNACWPFNQARKAEIRSEVLGLRTAQRRSATVGSERLSSRGKN